MRPCQTPLARYLLVCTGGIGENDASTRAFIGEGLEALGIRVDLDPAQAARSLREHHFAFFFAPKYHPAFRHLGPARKLCAERGRRTIFNFLGPLMNPARPSAKICRE